MGVWCARAAFLAAFAARLKAFPTPTANGVVFALSFAAFMDLPPVIAEFPRHYRRLPSYLPSPASPDRADESFSSFDRIGVQRDLEEHHGPLVSRERRFAEAPIRLRAATGTRPEYDTLRLSTAA